jgi:protein SCO1
MLPLHFKKFVMKNKWLVYIGFFVVLVTAFLYFVFRDYDFSRSKLIVINANVPEFSFINYDGRPFNDRTVEDKVYVAEYFFTTCKGICPKMNANMRRVYNEFRDNEKFLIVSHTCQPEVDSLPLLKKYANRMMNGKLSYANGSYSVKDIEDSTFDAVKSNWFFATGDKSSLYRLARQGYMIDNGTPDSTQNINDQFIHSQFFALVDRNRRVRGIYDGLKENEIQKLIADIHSLLKEKVVSKRFMDGFGNNPG